MVLIVLDSDSREKSSGKFECSGVEYALHNVFTCGTLYLQCFALTTWTKIQLNQDPRQETSVLNFNFNLKKTDVYSIGKC